MKLSEMHLNKVIDLVVNGCFYSFAHICRCFHLLPELIIDQIYFFSNVCWFLFFFDFASWLQSLSYILSDLFTLFFLIFSIRFKIIICRDGLAHGILKLISWRIRLRLALHSPRFKSRIGWSNLFFHRLHFLCGVFVLNLIFNHIEVDFILINDRFFVFFRCLVSIRSTILHGSLWRQILSLIKRDLLWRIRGIWYILHGYNSLHLIIFWFVSLCFWSQNCDSTSTLFNFDITWLWFFKTNLEHNIVII